MTTDTLKTTTEAYWGALGKLPALDAIFRACEQLETEEVPLNRDNVKARSGITYTNLLATGLKLYRRRQDEFADAHYTPTSVLHLLAQAVEREFASLQRHFEDQLASWQADTDTLQSDLIQELDHLRAHGRQQAAELQERNAQLEALIEAQHALQTQLKSAEQTGRELAQRYQSALGEGVQLRKALTEAEHRQLVLTRDHQAELEAVKVEQRQQRQELIAQHDKETARLQTQLGNERGEWKQTRVELERSLVQARDSQAATQAQLNDTQRALSDTEQALNTALQQVAHLNEAARNADERHRHEHALWQTQFDQQAKTVVQLETELQLLKRQDSVQLPTRQQVQDLLDRLPRAEPPKP